MKKLILYLLAPCVSFAQQPAERWEENQNISGYSGSPYIFSVEMDDDGNTYVGGYIFNNSDSDIFVAKYDSDGNLAFYDAYDSGAGDDEGFEVGYDQWGNTYIAGNERNGNGLFLRKYNTTGVVQWTKTYYGAIVFTHVNDMEVRQSTGDVFLTGRLTNAVSGEGANLFLIRYDTNGNVSWEESFDGGSNLADEGHRIVLDGSGNVYVIGEANAGTPTLQKYTYAGAFSWGKSPDVTGENGSNGVTLAIEGTNIAVYTWTNKKRYSQTGGVLNQNVSFNNTVGLVSGRPYYWNLGTGYVRAVSSSSIKRYNNSGTQTATTSVSLSNRFIMDDDERLYALSNVSTAPDSMQVKRYSFGTSSIMEDWNYRFAESALNTFAISENHTFSVGYGDNGVLNVHNACVPPELELTLDSEDGGTGVCTGDTMFFEVDAEYADSYSWFNNGYGPNSDTIWVGLNFGVNQPIDLSVSVDAGNGCTVTEAFDQFTNYVGVDAYIVDMVGECESDPGFLFSLIDANYYEYNWYFDGVQQTFNASNDTIFLTEGNGTYIMEIYDTQTGCLSIPNGTIDVTGIVPDETATLSYPSSLFAQNESDPLPSVSGVSGGTYSESTGNLSIDPNTGVIDLSASVPGGPYTVVYTTPGTCPGQGTFDVTITSVVGIGEGSETNDLIYPNPAAETLYAAENVNSIMIYTLDGKMILTSDQRRIDVAQLASGSYLVKLEKMDGIGWQRLVIR